MRRGRTCGDNRNVWTSNVLQDADVARRDIDNTAGYEERRHPARAALQHFLVRVFNRLDATHAGTHGYTDRVTILFANFEPGIGYRVNGRGNAVVDERVDLASLFGRQIVVNVKVFDRTAYSGWKLTGVKVDGRLLPPTTTSGGK